MITDRKLVMTVAGGAAMSYKKKKPNADVEEILSHVMKVVVSEENAKVFGIAAANYILEYLKKHPNATEKEVMQNLVNEINEIINSIEEQMSEE
ncbi:MAG TPA: hypothetical protein VJH65_02645 [Candidatus Nanoarchaeia archaeon]|nr:hypothetical protein [Candidatus Nanoarchaeia archaeon]